MDLTVCPECDELAEVQWRAVMESTDGPVEHAKVVCVRRHWFLLPVSQLARSSGRRTPDSPRGLASAPGSGVASNRTDPQTARAWWREEWEMFVQVIQGAVE